MNNVSQTTRLVLQGTIDGQTLFTFTSYVSTPVNLYCSVDLFQEHVEGRKACV